MTCSWNPGRKWAQQHRKGPRGGDEERVSHSDADTEKTFASL